MMNRIDAYMAEYATYSAYFVPEILSLEDGFVEKEIERLDGLKEYKFLLENILKEKPHVLSEKEEDAVNGITIPFHKGAAAYYAEHGIEVKTE